MTSYRDKGQMFGTDGHVTWTEPALFDVAFEPTISELDQVLDKARKVAELMTDDTEAMF